MYEDRPAVCRYYALGSMGVRKKEASSVDDIYFVVKEDHCLGHNEPKKHTVAEYRHAQGFDKYDEMNREWRDIILKNAPANLLSAPLLNAVYNYLICVVTTWIASQNLFKAKAFYPCFQFQQNRLEN